MVDPVNPPGVTPNVAPPAPAAPTAPPAVAPSQAPSPNQAGATALNPGDGKGVSKDETPPDARAPHKGEGPKRSSIIHNPASAEEPAAEEAKPYVSEATKAEMEAGKQALGRHAPAKE